MAEAASERDLALLLDMLLAAQDATSFIVGMDEAGFLASALHQNAVIRCLEIVGEAANKVSPAFRDDHPEISWRQIINLRHRLIHGYAEVRLDVVWGIASRDLQPLIATLQAVVPAEDDWSA